MRKKLGYEINGEITPHVMSAIESFSKTREIDYLVCSLDSERPLLTTGLPRTKTAQVCLKFQHFWNLRFITQFWELAYDHSIDIILIDTDEDPTEDDISLLNTFNSWGVVIKDGTLGRIDKFSEKMGSAPGLILTPLNPIKYSPEVLNYAKEKGVTIIGTEVYGNPESREWMIRSCGQGYLEEFTYTHSDGIILPPMEVVRLINSTISILDHPTDKVVDTPEEFIWKDKVHPAKRKINMYGLNSLPGFILPWDNPYNSGVTIHSRTDKVLIPEDKVKYPGLGEELESMYRIPDNFTWIEARTYAEFLGLSYILALEKSRKNVTVTLKHDLSFIEIRYPWPYSIFKKPETYAVIYDPIKRYPALINLKRSLR